MENILSHIGITAVALLAPAAGQGTSNTPSGGDVDGDVGGDDRYL